MKKWTGGTLILTLLLSPRYCLYSSIPRPTKHAPSNSPPLPSTNLPGLSELFSTKIFPNLANQSPNFDLIWAYMLPLLFRPDALPATADGVRESAIVWKGLVADIEAEKDADFGTGEERKKCPFSVNGNNESVVEVPCWLVQDSAVTIVGVPVGRNGSSWFGFELVGDGNGDGDELPLVLRINVSIGGDEGLLVRVCGGQRAAGSGATSRDRRK